MNTEDQIDTPIYRGVLSMTDYEKRQLEHLKFMAEGADFAFEAARVRRNEAHGNVDAFLRKINHVPGPLVPATAESAAADTKRWMERA